MLNMFFFPLEQFKVEILSAFRTLTTTHTIFYNVDVVWAQVILLVALPLILSFFFSFTSPILRAINHVFRFLIGLVVSYVSPIMEWITVLIITLFFFILLCNNLGLVPNNFCITAQFIVTFSLSSLIFFGLLYYSAVKGGLHFVLHFIPSNVPAALKPFLMVIEIVSFISRLFSLAIRLFANLVAGHSLLHILVSSELAAVKLFMLVENSLLIILVLPLLLIAAITVLETGIASLQAYVFSILSLIYAKEAEVFFL